MCHKLEYNKSKQARNMHKLNEKFENISCETIELNSINKKTNRDEVFAKLNVNLPSFKERNTTLKVKVDTGTQENALPIRLFRTMFPDSIDKTGNPLSLTPSNKILTSYGGHKI